MALLKKGICNSLSLKSGLLVFCFSQSVLCSDGLWEGTIYGPPRRRNREKELRRKEPVFLYADCFLAEKMLQCNTQRSVAGVKLGEEKRWDQHTPCVHAAAIGAETPDVVPGEEREGAEDP